VEFVPFRAATAAGVACIMSAHVLVPSLDEEQPGTLSPTILGLLRDELGFEGMVVSDDLEMQAITKTRTTADAAVAALKAGCDAVLVCSGDVDIQAAVLEAIVHAVESGVLPLARIDDAIARGRRQKARFLGTERRPARTRVREWRSVVGCEAHQIVAAEMAAFA
jgi:beta-N-acetylhexosaminidase